MTYQGIVNHLLVGHSNTCVGSKEMCNQNITETAVINFMDSEKVKTLQQNEPNTNDKLKDFIKQIIREKSKPMVSKYKLRKRRNRKPVKHLHLKPSIPLPDSVKNNEKIITPATAKKYIQMLRMYYEQNGMMDCFIRNPLNELEEHIDQEMLPLKHDPRQKKITEFFEKLRKPSFKL